MGTTRTNAMKWLLTASVIAGLMGANIACATTATTTTNTIVVNVAPTAILSVSSNSINIGNALTFTANVPSGGLGPFTVNLVYNSNVVNTISDVVSGTSITFVYTPVDLGTLSFDAVATDTGTAPSQYVFNSIVNTVTVNPLLPFPTANFVVDIPSSIETSLDYTNANAVLSITSSDSITSTVLISNVTSGYASTPTGRLIAFTKLAVLNLDIISNTPSSVSYGVTLGIPCGSDAAPYKLTSGTWTALPYTSNTAACTITFNVPPDPIIGLFTSYSTAPGGNSGSGSYYVASNGGGMPSGPSLTQFSQNGEFCYQIANFTNPNSESFTLNGTSFDIVASAIAPNSTALIINGKTYIILPNSPVGIGSNSGFNYTADLTGISYLPILHTATVDVCSIAIPAVAAPTNTSATNTTVPTTTIRPTTTTVPATTTIVATPPKPSAAPPASSNTYLIAAIIAVIAVVLVLAYRRTFKNGKKDEKA
jgi:hypothetical protein